LSTLLWLVGVVEVEPRLDMVEEAAERAVFAPVPDLQ